jgi:sugar lactone lactonase YvrE
MGESPRWHDGRLWVADWGAQEILTLDRDGARDVELRGAFGLPFSIDWLRDGRLLVVSGRQGLLLRREPDGTLVTHADLRALSTDPWNEIVVDGRGNVYVNGGPGAIVVIPAAGGAPRQVADGIAFANGMAVTADNSTLIIAESWGRRLTAFDVEPDGGLSRRRVWADLGDGAPVGITIDAEGAVWYADVPHRRCVRVREGGEVLQTIDVDRGCFACMLGGDDGRTLYIVANEWRGMDKIAETAAARTGVVLAARAPAPHSGWP